MSSDSDEFIVDEDLQQEYRMDDDYNDYKDGNQTHR